MDEEERGREAFPAQTIGLAPATAAVPEQAVAVDDVGIGCDRVEALAPPALRADAGHEIAERLDLVDRIAEPHRAAEPLEMTHHSIDERVRAAAREPHAAVALELVDQSVDGARCHRIAADEEGVKAEGLPQLLVLHVARDDRIDGSPRLMLGERRRGADHGLEIEERDMAEPLIALGIDAGRIIEEVQIAAHILRLDRRDLPHQGGIVVGIIEGRAVRPAQAVERRDRHQLDVGRHVRVGERPQFLEAGGIGDDRRPGVERVAVLLPMIGAAAGLVPALDQRGRNARRLQPDREREPAEAGADDRGLLHRRRLI